MMFGLDFDSGNSLLSVKSLLASSKRRFPKAKAIERGKFRTTTRMGNPEAN